MNFRSFKEKYQKTEVEHFAHNVTSTPLVSVMVQTYNHEAYIAECLDGILNQQTEFAFEILLGEDVSTDKTRKICIDYALRVPEKIRLFLHHTSNKIKVMGIPTGNFNAFYNYYQAQGEFIAFCEGDDYWNDPLKLQKQVDFLKKNTGFVLSYHRFVEQYETASKKKKQIPLEQPAKDLNQKELSELIYHPLLSTVCFRKCLSELPEEMLQVINVDSFLLSLLGNYGEARYLWNINPSFYNRHSGGIWTENKKELSFFSKLHTYKNLITYYRSKGKNKTARVLQGKRKKIINQLFFYYLSKRKFKSVIKFLMSS
ncbi:MAG: glycosyltransferase family A protein [Salegentibacter mishustinae]|nr:glycosyltransferase family A protein [Salegentibacter mishustinae]